MNSLYEQLEQLLEQENRLQFAGFSFADGVNIGLDILDRARSENLPIVVDVFAFGQLLFHAALPGSRADNAEWVARKRNTVLRFAHSSLYMGVSAEANGTTMDEKFYLPPRQYASHGGGFPILLRDGGVIGAVTVSGLAQKDDHDRVVTALEAHLSKA